MKNYTKILGLLVLAMFAACSPEELREVNEESVDLKLTSKNLSLNSETKRVTYKLEEADVPGVYGDITIRDAGNMGVEVILKLENTTAGLMHPVHIHEGLVGADGPRAKTLNPVN